MIIHGPTGNVVQGHVLDVDRRAFERALKGYDPQLYTRWSPTKLRGWGCWEIRRRPEYSSIVDYAPLGNGGIFRLERAENEVLHHVLDCAFLNYDQLRKLKEMDTWQDNHWVHDLEYREGVRRQKQAARARDELKYTLKHNKRVFEEFKELVRSGINPARIVLGK